jgi:hypothetical protein
MTRMDRRRASTACALLLAAGCSHGATQARTGAAPAAERGKAEVLVGPEAFRDSQVVLASWLTYGARKAELYLAHPPPQANQSADDFELEIGAREAQCTFWSEQRKKDAPAQAALDRQVDIWKAGFLPELVVLVHAHPGWTIPGARVAAFRFEEFTKRFPGNYAPTPVTLKPASGKLVPDVPGADFPDPERLPIGARTCSEAVAERSEAWTRWASLEPQLGGLPVAASDSIDFARRLNAARTDPAFAGHAVTWVSPRVGHLGMLEGFCAVEAKDWPRAVTTLTRAALLMPNEPLPHLELSLALTSLRRHDEALRQVDRALVLAADGCAGAAAWRRRGFILFELGAFDEAREAYEKSLQLEPGNAMALGELGLIADERSRGGAGKTSGKGGAAGAGPYAPPPSNVVLTVCRDGRTRPANQR